MPTLKFLDSQEVTEREREEARQQSQFLTVITYKDDDNQTLTSDDEMKNTYTPLANSMEPGNNDDPKGIKQFIMKF